MRHALAPEKSLLESVLEAVLGCRDQKRHLYWEKRLDGMKQYNYIWKPVDAVCCLLGRPLAMNLPTQVSTVYVLTFWQTRANNCFVQLSQLQTVKRFDNREVMVDKYCTEARPLPSGIHCHCSAKVCIPAKPNVIQTRNNIWWGVER